MSQNLSFQEFVMLDGDTIVTDSRLVAAHFGKQHKNVLRDIYAMRDSKKSEIRAYYELNFEPVEELDAKGELRILFRMTRNGFLVLTMGFTGEQALLIKIAFIDAFDAMAEYIKKHERSISERRHDYELRDATSKTRASYGSHLMLERKRDLPSLEAEHFRLKAESQLVLPMFDNEDMQTSAVRTGT
ncbi:Rha family transcriptional regulator [Burkholderia pseudomallei]|uniref:Rha family transcriptional regulator n=1 Tax=Burkholderia pseudomallei TaxID=28450 RepID=UPI0006836C27|nr:Rha family transcriptional regulator [Burkholderia pseudomallei]